MRFVAALLAILASFQFGNGYIFPICSSDDDSCITLFKTTPWPFYSQQPAGDEEFDTLVDKHVPGPIYRTYESYKLMLTEFCEDKINPVFFFAYEMIIESLHFISKLADYFPYGKELRSLVAPEPKVRADSRLYFLFILTSLGVYLALYTYFTKKLCGFYRNRLQQNCLDNFTKAVKDAKAHNKHHHFM